MKRTVLQIDAQNIQLDEEIIKRITEIKNERVETKPLSELSWLRDKFELLASKGSKKEGLALLDKLDKTL